jgi:hypothetical protein
MSVLPAGQFDPPRPLSQLVPRTRNLRSALRPLAIASAALPWRHSVAVAHRLGQTNSNVVLTPRWPASGAAARSPRRNDGRQGA